MAEMATYLNVPCPECETKDSLVRDDSDNIIYCSECGSEFLPEDEDYPREV